MEWAIGWLIVMVIFAFIVDRLLAWAPLSGGSGIPQIEGEMLGLFDMKPYRTLASKMIGGVLTGFAGFSVGREGPAVQIGGSAGKIVSYWMNSGLREQRILTSAGAGAGLTAAFSAPVSGAMFVFEEVHKSFYPYLVIPTFVATLISNYITVSIFGLEPALGFSVTSGVPLEYFPVLLMVGVIMGLCGVLFCRMIFAFKKFFEWLYIGGLSCGRSFKRAANLRFLIASHEWAKQSRSCTNILPNEGACSGKLYRCTTTRLGIARGDTDRKYSSQWNIHCTPWRCKTRTR